MAKQPNKDQKPVTPPKAIQGAQADDNNSSPPPAPRHSKRLRPIHPTRLKALKDEALRAPIEERAEFSDSAGGLRWWRKASCSAASPDLQASFDLTQSLVLPMCRSEMEFCIS
ncbi:hypothetical protein MBLNU13_g05226t2 [Cladosporium sp. NU13]